MSASIGVTFGIIGALGFGVGALMTIWGTRDRDWFGTVFGVVTCLCGSAIIAILIVRYFAR